MYGLLSPPTPPQERAGTALPVSRRTAKRLAVGLLALAAAVPTFGATASATTTPRYSYTGSAFGTYVTVGSLVKSGPSARVTLGCTANGNLHFTNNIAGVNLAPVATTGAVSTTADTYSSPVRSRTSANTAQVNLLNGLVRATAVKAVSSTTKTSTGWSVSASGTTLTGLVVAGSSISASTPPNTRKNIAGFGYVIINEQVKRTNGLTVNALHLVITSSNKLGIAVGTNVVVSQAVSGLSGPVAGVLSGYAYGSQVDVGTVATSGASFVAFLPCLGTGGAVRTNTGAGVTLGTALKTGTITNTVKGTLTASSATGETTSTVQSVDLLNGLVKASVIKAGARSYTSGSTFAYSDLGSSFGSLTVAGHPEIGPKVAPNTRVDLPGIGTLYLHRVVKSSRSVTVIMIQLVLSHPTNGLPAGANIRVAVAKAGAS